MVSDRHPEFPLCIAVSADEGSVLALDWFVHSCQISASIRGGSHGEFEAPATTAERQLGQKPTMTNSIIGIYATPTAIQGERDSCNRRRTNRTYNNVARFVKARTIRLMTQSVSQLSFGALSLRRA